jgi:hypothetical protein
LEQAIYNHQARARAWKTILASCPSSIVGEAYRR